MPIERDRRVQPMEIKSGATVAPDRFRAAQKGARFVDIEAHPPWCVHGGDERYARSGVEQFRWRRLGEAP